MEQLKEKELEMEQLKEKELEIKTSKDSLKIFKTL